MKTTILPRLYALALSATFATVATFGVAVLMADSGERAHIAAVKASSTTALTQAPIAADAKNI